MDIENMLNAKSPATVSSSSPQSPQMSQPQLAHHGYYSQDHIKADPGMDHLATHSIPERMSQYPIPPLSNSQSNAGLSNVFSEGLPYPGRANPQPYSAAIQQQYASAGLQESGMNQNALLGTHLSHSGHVPDMSVAQETSQLKSFACSTCSKAFARRSDLARHERIHSGIRPHVCSHEGCNKEFIQRSALTVHERVHTGEKPHICESCAKPFSDSSSLARHRRIHTGKRPYKCPYPNCQKTFTRKTTLTRHQNHHAGTIEEATMARDAALTSRPHDSETGHSGPSDMDERSEGTSSLAASSPGQHPHVPTNHASFAHGSMLRRQSSDIAYSTAKNAPSNFRGELHQPDSTSSRASHSHIHSLLSHVPGQVSITSDPSSYRQRYAKSDHEQHYRRDTPQDSPHMSPSSWSSENHNGLPSQGLGYATPEYPSPVSSLYYSHAQPQRMWSGP